MQYWMAKSLLQMKKGFPISVICKTGEVKQMENLNIMFLICYGWMDIH